MLAAFEASLRRSAKDEGEWKRTLAMLTAEPAESRRSRRTGGIPAAGAGRMTVDGAEALLARMAADEAMYG